MLVFLMQLIIREIHYYLKISSKCSILKILTRCIPISDFNRNVRGKFRNGIGTPQSEINTFVIWSKLQKRAYHQFRFTKRCTVRWKAEMAKKSMRLKWHEYEHFVVWSVLQNCLKKSSLWADFFTSVQICALILYSTNT